MKARFPNNHQKARSVTATKNIRVLVEVDDE